MKIEIEIPDDVFPLVSEIAKCWLNTSVKNWAKTEILEIARENARDYGRSNLIPIIEEALLPY